MHQISDTIERKFVDSLEIEDWDIETESGWVNITHINKTVEYDVWQLKTTNCFIECADTHIVFREDGSEVFVKDLVPGDILRGQFGGEIVEFVSAVPNRKEHMYDLSVTGNHTFYAEGLLHHNTTTAAAYFVWYALFNNNKSIAILANKQATADEIMARIRMAYEYLPKWIQVGIKDWNKRSIGLENGSRIFCAATSSSGVRGKTINVLYCVAGKTRITLKEKLSGKIITTSIIDFANNFNLHLEESTDDQTLLLTDDWEVFTPNGWKSFEGVVANHHKNTIVLNSGLECTANHKLFIGGELALAETLPHVEGNTDVTVYDLFNVAGGHLYYTDNDISSNCDEIAFVQNNLAEDFFTSVYPTIIASQDSKVIMTSTPNGFNHFYKFWNEAEKGLNNFVPIRCHWYEMPGRDKKWYDDQVKALGELKASQEIDACLGGDSVVTIRNKVSRKITRLKLVELAALSHFDLYEILTPTGWNGFDGVRKTVKDSVLIQTTSASIIASLDHRFMINGKEIRAKSLLPQQKLAPNVSVVKIKLIGECEVYDVLNVENGSVYLHDCGITSHNCFLGSSKQLLNNATMANLTHDHPIKVFEDYRRGLLIYKPPMAGRQYTMTVDVSRGRHLDSSAFIVFDITQYPHTMVATFNNNEVAPMQYSNIVYQVAKQYNYAYVLIETNDIGAQVADELYHSFEYDNMYWTKSGDQLGKKGADPYPGIRTTKKTKRIGCSNLKDIVEKQEVLINDLKTIQELSTFVQNGSGSYEADEGFHDDMVACLFLYAWLVTQPWFKDLYDKDIRNKMYQSNITKIEEELTPFGFIDVGQDAYESPEEMGNRFLNDGNRTEYF